VSDVFSSGTGSPELSWIKGHWMGYCHLL